jgi:hypothetical protein
MITYDTIVEDKDNKEYDNITYDNIRYDSNTIVKDKDNKYLRKTHKSSKVKASQNKVLSLPRPSRQASK